MIRCVTGAPFPSQRTLRRLHFRRGREECEAHLESCVVDCYFTNLEV